ncbi:unnamed protein product [Lactuca virosa]|uniref:F-box associated beta-propeller type 3 domain-containing protein n=1 Tax=Lactuca virosa TaxID=75947 RepID=A0AAU9MH49_9ASTR|nr:unnamed protein product [Lactuca virosa]
MLNLCNTLFFSEKDLSLDQKNSRLSSPATTSPNDYGESPRRHSCSPDIKLTRFYKLPVNTQFESSSYTVIGSVNGLICFYYKSYNDDYLIHIWNPSLSAVLTLPPYSLSTRISKKIYLRFGFDPKTDDYKVVKFTSLFQPCNEVAKGEVYSMRKGSWELISQRLPPHVISNQNKVDVDDIDSYLHWLFYIDKEMKARTIVAFDLGAETFCEIPLPDSILDYTHWYNVVGVLSGKLCVISRGKGGKCEVWVMEEYRVAASWVKRHVFSHLSGGIIPYGITLHNEFLLKVDGGFCLYDPISAKNKTFEIKGRIHITEIVEYIDSLVWVAPAEHALSKGHLSVSNWKRYRLLKGLQKATKGISQFLFCEGISR